MIDNAVTVKNLIRLIAQFVIIFIRAVKRLLLSLNFDDL